MCTELETLEHSDLSGTLQHNPPPRVWGSTPEVGRLCEMVMADSKETASSRPNRTHAHMNSQRLPQHTDMHRLKPEKIPTWRRDGGLKVPGLTKKLFAIIICWQRENPGPWVYQPHSRTVPMPRSNWPMQNRLYCLRGGGRCENKCTHENIFW